MTNEAGFSFGELAAQDANGLNTTASLTGFQKVVRSGIAITVGRNAVVDVALAVGDVTQAVTVQGDVSQVETAAATVSNLVDERRVLDIPLNNRDLTQLAYFTAGVLKVPTVGSTQSGTSAGGLGDKLSVNGARDGQNLYVLNGVPNNDVSGNAQSASGAYSGAETIKEFQVITNAYSSEYPSVAGAILTAVTKSGTNQFHGSVFEFLRNDNVDAAKWEDNAFGRPKPNSNAINSADRWAGRSFKNRRSSSELRRPTGKARQHDDIHHHQRGSAQRFVGADQSRRGSISFALAPSGTGWNDPGDGFRRRARVGGRHESEAGDFRLRINQARPSIRGQERPASSR